jgi:hypothetical protein
MIANGLILPYNGKKLNCPKDIILIKDIYKNLFTKIQEAMNAGIYLDAYSCNEPVA